VLVCLSPERDTLIRKVELAPAQCASVELFEVTLLGIMAGNGDACQIGARKLVEVGDRKQHVLERVEPRVFCCSRGCVCGQEKAHSMCEAQVRFALGRRTQGRGITSGSKEGS